MVSESVLTAQAPVANPGIPASVVSEQNKDGCPQEQNADTVEQKKADTKLLEESSDAEAAAEVTVVWSTSSVIVGLQRPSTL